MKEIDFERNVSGLDITKAQVLEKWTEWEVENKLLVKLIEPLQGHHLSFIKNTNSLCVLKINTPSVNGPYPIIVKINKGPIPRKQTEWLLFKNIKETELKEFIPDVYEAQVCHDDETWVFMEYLTPFDQEKELTVDHMYRMVSRVAELHAATFEHQPVSTLLSGILSGFQSKGRTHHLDMMKSQLQQAKEDPFLSQLINDHCPELYQLVEIDLDFPEVMKSGLCLNHGDLHIGNICYDSNERIKFIDFSAATYSPCWLDVVKLIEFMMDHHPEWGGQRKIRNKALRLYIQTMKKGGVKFTRNCYRLYRAAYLMTVFEKELRRHIKAILQGETRHIFPGILKKISRFRKRLHLRF